MGCLWKKVEERRGFNPIPLQFFEVISKLIDVARDIDDYLWPELVQSFDCLGMDAASRGIDDHEQRHS